MTDCGDRCNETEVCCKEPAKCDPNAGVADESMTHTCDDTKPPEQNCDYFKEHVLCGDGCYSRCWASATNIDWPRGR